LTLASATADFDDISSADTKLIPIGPGLTGQLIQVRAVIAAAISGADDKLVVKKNATAIGTVTIAYSGSSGGDQYYLDFADSQIYLSEGDRIALVNGGESSDTAACGVTVTIKR